MLWVQHLVPESTSGLVYNTSKNLLIILTKYVSFVCYPWSFQLQIFHLLPAFMFPWSWVEGWCISFGFLVSFLVLHLRFVVESSATCLCSRCLSTSDSERYLAIFGSHPLQLHPCCLDQMLMIDCSAGVVINRASKKKDKKAKETKWKLNGTKMLSNYQLVCRIQSTYPNESFTMHQAHRFFFLCSSMSGRSES